jgi:glycosyltransferase involved in cell wall biosynthesis
MNDPDVMQRIIEGGVIADMATALVRRSPLKKNIKAKLVFQLHEIMRREIQRVAAAAIENSTHIIANVGTALLPFKVSQNLGSRRVLHYPSAHPRYFARVWLDEMKQNPLFAKTAPNFGQLSEEILSEYDEEIEISDAIVVGSSFVANSFYQFGISREKIKIIPYGVDQSIFYPSRTPTSGDEFTVLFVGRLEIKKGISYLLEGFKKFTRPGARLKLIGQMTGSAEPLEQYKELYEHTANLSHGDLAQEMRSATVLVLPSLLEGLPLSVMEAMASGLPVITTPCGAEDLVRDGVEGYIVPMRDSNAIADALNRLYDDREKAIEMGKNAANRINEFSWANFASNYRNFLSEI